MDAQQQINSFKDFIEQEYYSVLLEKARIGQQYLVLDFGKISMFDVNLAEDLLENPEEVIKAAQIAIEQFDLPEESKEFNVRINNLPETQKMMIRNIRSKHLGKLLSMEGTVRQKTDVRPHVTSSRFECPACGNVIPVLQLDNKFKEPTRCGCGRKGKFKLLSKELVDAQSLTLEESAEDMDGGEQPKRMKVFLKDDLVSPLSEKKTNPGTKIVIVGYVKEIPVILRTGGQSTRFDLMIEANYVESTGEEFEDIKVTTKEEEEIKNIATSPKVIDTLVKSLAPSIYGHEKIKEALLLQLVGGVRKIREDGGKSRGDMHILLIGDPGAGKCVSGDTKIILEDGTINCIKNLVDNDMSEYNLPVLGLNGKSVNGKAIRTWKRKSEENLMIIKTRLGKKLKVTQDHPLFESREGYIIAKEARHFKVGDRIATPRKINIKGSIQFLEKFTPKKYSNNSKVYNYPTITDSRLARLAGFLCGDGYLNKSNTSAWISLTSKDIDSIQEFQRLMKILFNANITKRDKEGSTEAYVLSKGIYDYFVANFSELLGGSRNKRVPKLLLKSPDYVLAEFIKTLFECDAHVNIKKRQIEYCTISKELAQNIHLSLLRFGIISLVKNKVKYATNTINKRKVKAYEIIISGKCAQEFHQRIGFFSKRKRKQLDQLISNITNHNTNIDLIPGINMLLKDLRSELQLKQKEMGIPRTTYEHYENNDRLPSIESVKKVVDHMESKGHKSENLRLLKHIANSDVFWDEILSIEQTDSKEEVYDFEVSEVHNFIANGVVVHNSQLLKRIHSVAPKARFVSGKGASGAGLTASVVKDEFMGGWALEAGALVLANRGLICIDELDKMSKDDTSSMHEALEGQTVTISKANIQATLRCETTVLAAANPKFGRFDPYSKTIAEQIELPSTLINRFDLIFPIKDMPDPTKDEKLARFVLTLHQDELKTDCDVDTDLLRKYISYVKTRKPKLTEGAINELVQYYLTMRGSGGGEGSVRSIPISARQLEGLVRMTEAYAKIRLSEKATKKDAKSAIDLLDVCLKQIAYDEETGTIDIDRIATGITTSSRNKIINIKAIISELEEKIGKTIPIEDIIALAIEKGMEEDEIDTAIEKLKRSGDIFEPKRGFISRI